MKNFFIKITTILLSISLLLSSTVIVNAFVLNEGEIIFENMDISIGGTYTPYEIFLKNSHVTLEEGSVDLEQCYITLIDDSSLTINGSLTGYLRDVNFSNENKYPQHIYITEDTFVDIKYPATLKNGSSLPDDFICGLNGVDINIKKTVVNKDIRIQHCNHYDYDHETFICNLCGELSTNRINQTINELKDSIEKQNFEIANLESQISDKKSNIQKMKSEQIRLQALLNNTSGSTILSGNVILIICLIVLLLGIVVFIYLKKKRSTT